MKKVFWIIVLSLSFSAVAVAAVGGIATVVTLGDPNALTHTESGHLMFYAGLFFAAIPFVFHSAMAIE